MGPAHLECAKEAHVNDVGLFVYDLQRPFTLPFLLSLSKDALLRVWPCFDRACPEPDEGLSMSGPTSRC